MKGNNGPNNGAPFLRPAYDSGWVKLAAGELKELQHNVGGNMDDYLMNMSLRLGPKRNMAFWDSSLGATWSMSSNTSIVVFRELSETYDQVRIRIWIIRELLRKRKTESNTFGGDI